MKLQLDNCTDNKCAVVFAYAAYLVETGVFLVVELHFLPCGHTHIRIDQIFSVINKSCKKEGGDPPLTFPLFQQRVKGAFSGIYKDRIKTVTLLKGIHDWTSLLKPLIDPNFAGYGHTQLSGIQILYFEFQKNCEGKAAMSYKYDYLDEFVYPHPFGDLLSDGGRVFTARGQEFTVKSITMTEGLDIYDHKYNITITGNEGMKIMPDVQQKGIVIFHSSSPDMDDICVYPIPETYAGILKDLDSTIASLYISNHEGMKRTRAFDWWHTFIQGEMTISKLSSEALETYVPPICCCARDLELNEERKLTAKKTVTRKSHSCFEHIEPVTHSRWTKYHLSRSLKLEQKTSRRQSNLIYKQGSYGISRFDWPSSTRAADKKGFHLDLCLFEFLTDVCETAIETEVSILVQWYRSTAKTYNGQWAPWTVGKKRQASKSKGKRQKTEMAIWTSEIPIRDVVMSVEGTKEGDIVKIKRTSLNKVREYIEHATETDSDEDSE